METKLLALLGTRFCWKIEKLDRKFHGKMYWSSITIFVEILKLDLKLTNAKISR